MHNFKPTSWTYGGQHEKTTCAYGWFHEIIVSHHQNIPGYNILIYRLTGSVRLAYLMTQITATMMKAGGDDVVDISPPKARW